MRPKIGRLDHKIEIQQKITTQDPKYGTDVTTWIPLAIVYASKIDTMPGKDESLLQGALETHNQKYRFRLRWRDDVSSDMRVKILHPIQRTCEIIGGPAEIGHRKSWIEILCQGISTNE
jgi:SPP1 family predicted phage head-tail adaptor